MKDKALKLFSDYKYSLIIFAALSIQAIMNLTPMRGVGEYLYVYYLVDFSMGKTSRLLIGTIVNWLTDSPDIDWINRFVLIFIFVTLFLSAILAGRIISGVKEELRPHALIFALFLVSGPFAFANFTKFVGFLDIFMFLVALIAIAFLYNRYLQWLVPALCVIGVFIHQGFVLSFFPLVILASFYLTFVQERKNERKAVFVLTAVFTAASLLYCVLYGTDTVTIPFEKMCEIVEKRGSREFSDTALFNLGFFFYNHVPSAVELSTEQYADLSLWETFLELFKFTNITYLKNLRGLISIMSLALFVFAMFWIIWIRCIKNTEKKGKKFVYACFMLSTLIVPLYSLIAVDYIRWIQGGVLTQFGLIFFMFFMKDEPFEKAVAEIGEFFKNKKLFLVLMYLVYALAVQRDISG